MSETRSMFVILLVVYRVFVNCKESNNICVCAPTKETKSEADKKSAEAIETSIFEL